MKCAMQMETDANGNFDETGDVILWLTPEEAQLIHQAMTTAVSAQKTKRGTKLTRLANAIDKLPVW